MFNIALSIILIIIIILLIAILNNVNVVISIVTNIKEAHDNYRDVYNNNVRVDERYINDTAKKINEISKITNDIYNNIVSVYEKQINNTTNKLNEIIKTVDNIKNTVSFLNAYETKIPEHSAKGTDTDIDNDDFFSV